MAIHTRPVRRPPSLSPSRWPPLPRRGTVLRLTLATALLVLAAGVLYLRESAPTCPAAPPPPPPSQGSGDPDTARSADPAAPPGARLPLPAGMVGVPVRLAEPAALAVVRPGARVDLLVVPGTGTRATDRPTTTPVAARALVLDVLGADSSVDGWTALYLALPPDQAQRTVALPDGSRFAIIVRE